MSDSVSTIPPPRPDSARLCRASASLSRLSVGDALGERFFVIPDTVEQLIRATAIPRGTGEYTDDTVMAPDVVENLAENTAVEPVPLEQREPLSVMSSSALEGLS